MSARQRFCGLALTALSLVGCGREVGRVPFTSEGSKGMTLPLAPGKVAFWTDLDVKYQTPATLGYRIELVQGGRTVATADCDPLGKKSVQLGWLDIQGRGASASHGYGQMLCGATLAKGGPTFVRATLAFSEHPLKTIITRADLVVKQ